MGNKKKHGIIKKLRIVKEPFSGEVVPIKRYKITFLRLTNIFFPFYILQWLWGNLMRNKDEYLSNWVNFQNFLLKKNLLKHDERHRKILKEGYGRMKQQRVVFCGCVRDCGKFIKKNLRLIKKAGLFCKDYRIVIFESDSIDKSLKILRQYARENRKIKILHEKKKWGRFYDHSERRMRIMAYCRNKYLSYVKKHFSDFDYMVVFDWDSEGGFDIDGIANSIGQDNWDMIGANGLRKGKYYDSYPLRIKNFSDRSYIGGRQGKSSKKAIKQNRIKWIKAKRPKLFYGQELVPVASCFAGMGIYKMPVIRGCWYGYKDCEHVSFHKEICKRGHKRFFINPSLIVFSD